MVQKSFFYISLFIIITALSMVYADKDIKIIIFEERQIKGKIRRPQLIMIKAEQRPEFNPMVMQSLDKDLNVTEFSKGSAVEKSPYSGVFMFDGTKISNYVP